MIVVPFFKEENRTKPPSRLPIMIHLVYMPFGSITHPPLALGLFKAQLQQAGIPCRVHHFNLRFAQQINFGAYETIALFKGVQTQISEWLFAEAAWGEPIGPDAEEFLELCGEELGNVPHVPNMKTWLRQIRQEIVPAFLDECVQSLRDAGDVEVVTFSCTFFQTLASVALGRRLKQEFPLVKLTYGGACFHDEMGDELIRKIPWIDAVSVGETDDVIVPFFQAMLANKPPEGLQGILYRHGSDEVQVAAPYQPVTAQVLDALPAPNFDDFFTDAAAVGLTQAPSWQKALFLPYESSRGCWWGQKRHCTFCGLNADGINYRAKSAENLLNTFEYFARRYPIARTYRATDNILENDYFESLLPVLQEKPFGEDLQLFYEVRVTMTREQIKAMADARITCVQPGIESLSSHILKLMNKGTITLQNVFFLKCCREYGVMVLWNNLIRFPGETQEDYRQMAELIPKLVHFAPPPGGSPKVECHRFSPYFSEKERWLESMQPAAWYGGLFPSDRINLSRIAYYFDAVWKDTLEDEVYDEVVIAVLEWIRVWRKSQELPRLIYRFTADGNLLIEDTRWGRFQVWQLNAAEASIYQAIDAPITGKQLLKKLRGTAAGYLTKEEVSGVLAKFIDGEFALESDGFYLGIANASSTVDPPYEFRCRQFGYEPANQLSAKSRKLERISAK
ncbi:RiPP maturation radical SAM C-methyltransferase [Okeania sp. SIO2C9]|uniref:RiPP maturation radical SAM C-methyltransferase n=1 Tax=Okeania sp. SIO2C9 TaxID=2607791 RepID=UPI0025EFC257|nr:RiPP maturation radical SAM C-methyltransferase [Okeania sp. SIO2C9]